MPPRKADLELYLRADEHELFAHWQGVKGRSKDPGYRRLLARLKMRKHLAQSPELREQHRVNSRRWHGENRERSRVKCANRHALLRDDPAYKKENVERAAEYAKRPENREKVLRWSRVKTRDYRRRLREQILAAYGGICACCGDDHEEFLTIDHIDGQGAKHRKEMGFGNSSTKIYKWLIEQGYPKDNFRLLCYNCNCSRGRYGYCPHEREVEASCPPA